MEIAIHCLFLMTRSIIYENSIRRPNINDYGLFWYKDSKNERLLTLLSGIIKHGNCHSLHIPDDKKHYI